MPDDAVAALARVRSTFGQFLGVVDVAALAADERTRLAQVLVRAGGCRFLCAVQDVAHLERCLVAGGDYVRDVSLPVSEGGR